jgi:lipopolysaccharide/colanic/teichoic acid biosynthesis glycosyltransferase
LIISLLISLDSPGPVLFIQERIGQNKRKKERRKFSIPVAFDRRKIERRETNYYGQPFPVYKFRTMVENAERKCGPVWAKKNDPRITYVGKYLRKLRLDEIPQFFNVLQGKMSLVGPRPERYFFIQEFVRQIEDYPQRLNAKPGLTGLAQIESGYDSSADTVKRKVNYDLDYIKKWTLWSDFKIILKTFTVVFTGKGAF